MYPQLILPRFAPEIEQEFQASYHARVRSTLRLVSGVLTGTLAVYLLLRLRRFALWRGSSALVKVAVCVSQRSG